MKEEFEFYIKHSSEINRRFGGKHIAIVGNKVVASGDSAMGVLKKARRKYPKKRPVLTYVPEKDTLVLILQCMNLNIVKKNLEFLEK